MHIDVELPVVDNVVQVLSSYEQTRAQVVFALIGDRKPETRDVLTLVGLLHLLPWDPPLGDVLISLQVQHTCDSCCLHLGDIAFEERVSSNPDISVSYLVEVQGSEEVAIGFVDDSVYDPDLLLIFELDRPLLA